MRPAFCFALLSCGLVQAWDADGHGAIGMTCMSAIKTTALTQLKRLLGGKDIVDISPWSFQLTQRYGDLAPIFYQTQSRALEAGVVNCDYFNARDHCADGQCLVAALSHYFERLMAEPASSGGSLAAEYKPKVNLRLSDSDLIRLIVSLIGELHSVSKFGYEADDNGRLIPISFVDTSRKVDTTLFEYWDSVLVQKTIRDRPHFWFSGWTHMNNLSRQIIAHEQNVWQQHPNKTEVFELWAAGTFRDSCARAYRVRSKQALYSRLQLQLNALNPNAPSTSHDLLPVWPKDITAGETESNLQFKKDFIVPTNHLFADFDLVKHKILIAGLRLSFVVNHILTHKDAKKLRVGSAVQLKDAPIPSNSGMWAQSHKNAEGGKQYRDGLTPPQWTTNLVINMGIVGVLVIGFLAFLNFTGERVSPIRRRNGDDGPAAAAKAAKD